MTLDRFLEFAIDSGQRASENCRSGRQFVPLRLVVAPAALHAVATGKSIGDRLLIFSQHVDAEGAEMVERRPGR